MLPRRTEYHLQNVAFIQQPKNEILTALVKSEGNLSIINNAGDTPIHIAARSDNSELIDEFPADAIRTTRDGAGRTTLHVAIADNNTPIIEFLVNQISTDTAARNNSGSIPANLADNENVRNFLHAAMAEEIRRLRQERDNAPLDWSGGSSDVCDYSG